MVTENRRGSERRSDNSPHATPRELEVLGCVLRGDLNKQIAAELGITEQAVKDHVSTLLEKFNVPNRAALAEVAARLEFAGGTTGVDRSWMRDLFLHAQPQIGIARGPEIRYEAANEAFMQAIGNRPVIGRTMREVFPELAGKGFFEKVERVYATGLPLVEHEVEVLWDKGHGIQRFLVDYVVQPLHDADGRVNGIASFGVDVTEIVEQRRRAELVREELTAVLDEVPSGIVFVDEQGRLVKMNAAARRITRRRTDPEATLNEQTIAKYRIRYGDGRPMVLDEMPLARALRGESAPPDTYIFEVGDPPEDVTVRSSSRTLRDPDGRIRGALIVFTELSREAAATG